MRIKIFSLILAVCLVSLLCGLFYIQIVRHHRYRVMSEENRLKIVPLVAPRGTIFDRRGEAIVKDTVSFDAAVIYYRIKDLPKLAAALSSILGVPEEEMAAKIKKGKARPYSPVTVAEDIGIEEAIQVEEVGMDYPGLLLDVSAKRKYLHGSTASSVLGYLGLINRDEFRRLKPYGYRMDDLVGRDGVEKYYDEYLRGAHGGKQIEVDYRGREMKTMGFKEPASGKNVELTVDLALQRFCDSLIEDKKGAIIVIDPATGAVLAMSSAPSYDPAVFLDPKRRGEVGQILGDKEYPLLNRAISGVYPPGSVFKVVVATGALQTGLATEATTFSCPGYLSLGNVTFNCWKEGGHGVQAMREAIKNSCNVYFFRLGLILGGERIAQYARKLGLGRPTGIDLPGENAGSVPDPDWKWKRFKEKWYPGDTVNFSIGQGYLLCSPIQIARLVSVFANGGYLVQPYVVEKIAGISIGEREKVDLHIPPEVLKAVREGMREVVNDPRGTGMKAKLRDVVVAGKTGTAQTSKGRSHGWFMGFAPFDAPRVSVVVFDEYGGKGGYYAAETAGKVFRKADELGLLR